MNLCSLVGMTHGVDRPSFLDKVTGPPSQYCERGSVTFDKPREDRQLHGSCPAKPCFQQASLAQSLPGLAFEYLFEHDPWS